MLSNAPVDTLSLEMKVLLKLDLYVDCLECVYDNICSHGNEIATAGKKNITPSITCEI